MTAQAEKAWEWPLPEGIRLVFFHKHRTSARLRFLLFKEGVVVPKPLGPNARLSTAPEPGDNVLAHPASLASAGERYFSLGRGDVLIDPEFRVHGAEDEAPFRLLLAEFTALDPPFDAAEVVSGRFVSITEARGLGRCELEVLRLAYAHVLG